MELRDWQKKNNSFKKTLVFHFGTGAGFFSEYNIMLKGIVYCYIHKIRFVLYSKDATFAEGIGWNYFFSPFCDEVDDDIHATYNKRFQDQVQTVSIKCWINSLLRAIKYRDKKRLLKYAPLQKIPKDIRLIKKKYGFNYFTYDLWFDFAWRLNLSDILHIKGCKWTGVKQALSEIDNMIWHFNEKTQYIANEMIASLNLPDSYFGMQIRAGDKFKETKPIPIEEYFQILNNLSPEGGILFLLTDDYHFFKKVAKQYTQWRIFTLCQSSEKGYYNDAFTVKKSKEKYQQLMRLLVSVKILSYCEVFIGTRSANPGQYLQMKLSEEKLYYLD